MNKNLRRAQKLLNQPTSDADKIISLLNKHLQHDHSSWMAYHFKGMAYLKKKEYEKAISSFEQAIQNGADDPGTFYFLSRAFFQTGNYTKSELHARRAVDLKEDYFEGWMQTGAACRALGKLNEALNCYQKANQVDPKSAEVAFRIASIYRDQSNHDKALELFDIAIRINSDYLEAYTEKAGILRIQKKLDEADATLRQALKINNKFIRAKAELAELYKVKGDYEQAIEIYEELLESHPTVTGLRVNYALCKLETGYFEESEKNYLRAFKENPDIVEALSNYLMGLHYNPKRTKEEIFEAHLLWDQQYSTKPKPERPVPGNIEKGKKLRLGLLSGGLRAHPVGWMITLALENLPKDQFEIYCYSTNGTIDFITKRIYNRSDTWRPVIGYSEEVIAGMIRDDEIDILVELSGHSADNRLRTVNLEPAPVIVKWVGGLFNTTGLQAVDFLITDWNETPEGEEKFYTEKLVRMPDDYICFLPPEYAPDVGNLPAFENETITFGCFNNPTKINNEILDVWAEILNRVPKSRLFLKSRQYDTKALRTRIIEKMEECGVSENRLVFEGASPHAELLECYNRVDIALDPWPYSGGLTTCEALWMGVPVITKPGPTFAGRHSATHLMNAGFPDWVTDTWEEYVAKAVSSADDLERLRELRRSLRDKVAKSPLCNGKRFGAHLAMAFREMWKQWVDGNEQENPQWQNHIEIKPLAAESKEAKEQKRSLPDRESAQVIESWYKSVFHIIQNNGPEKKRAHGLPGNLIVSLTSYPKRFQNLPLTLMSLCTQTVSPNRIVLWIAEEDKKNLTKEIREFEKAGVEICFCEDLKSYKKIIPVLERFPDSFIAVADDDLYYRNDWLEQLTESWSGDQKEVVAHRAHRIKLDAEENLLPYKHWGWEYRESFDSSEFNFPTSGAGTLYPPGIFHEDVIKKDLFTTLAPTADDLWLYWMTRLNGAVYSIAKKPNPLIEWPTGEESALWKSNILEGENDRQIQNLIQKYGLPLPVGNGTSGSVNGNRSTMKPNTTEKEFFKISDRLFTDLQSSISHFKLNRRQSVAQVLRRDIVKHLLGQSEPDISYLQKRVEMFNSLTSGQYKNWQELLFHQVEFEKNDTILSVLQRKQGDLCEPAKKLVDKTSHLSFDGFDAIVHGSLSDGRYTPYSDVDISVFAYPDWLIDDKKRKAIRTEIKEINRAIVEIDPIGHHGCFINLKSDLQAYPEANMPIDVLNGGFSLNLESLDLKVQTRDSSDLAYLTLYELCTFFVNLPSRKLKLDALTIKNIISRFFIINLLHYELYTHTFSDKRTILTTGLKDIASEIQLECLHTTTAIREKWPAYDENKTGYLSKSLLEKCGQAAADILKHLFDEGRLDTIRKQWLQK